MTKQTFAIFEVHFPKLVYDERKFVGSTKCNIFRAINEIHLEEAAPRPPGWAGHWGRSLPTTSPQARGPLAACSESPGSSVQRRFQSLPKAESEFSEMGPINL